jgi:hypothetical protein
MLPDLKERDRQNRQYERQMRIQRAQLEQLESLAQIPAADLSYHVARNGQDIGAMPLTKINALLRAGKLNKADYYFDQQLNEWIALEYLDGVTE